MSHGFEMTPGKTVPLPAHPVLRMLATGLHWLNRWIIRLSMIAMLLTTLILTYSVISRYLFRVPTDWQDEASVFMLIGVTFFSAAYVQSYRGHIGIEVLSSLLSPAVNRWRLLLVDLLSMAFCGFFTWKSWTLFYEAWIDGQTTSSTFAPPLWIPYAMMAAGMTLLTLQLLIQVLDALTVLAMPATSTTFTGQPAVAGQAARGEKA
ncbi:TRAP transporter small permease [Undibacterium oligocarboniphilum]|uniref:TRAP transporter small permease protein n=1 Tax=Undibacterium oligocarboniphilum TaxID=666702 RepID=A0A850QJ62_9BURK|nr:TRAP transporter small permease [Undibacterium oligocarboniphilum]MBC3871654.1 TRAP transporter small permease [Undibacterium oligocarboniphilum]NVO79157.1 TRAP transporter small permease [Undibacterium oligocarboniphilum]